MNRAPHHAHHPEWLQREADLHRPFCPAIRRQRAAMMWRATGLTIGIVIGLACAQVAGHG